MAHVMSAAGLPYQIHHKCPCNTVSHGRNQHGQVTPSHMHVNSLSHKPHTCIGLGSTTSHRHRYSAPRTCANATSSSRKSEVTLPGRPARPVRPMRWMKSIAFGAKSAYMMTHACIFVCVCGVCGSGGGGGSAVLFADDNIAAEQPV